MGWLAGAHGFASATVAMRARTPQKVAIPSTTVHAFGGDPEMHRAFALSEIGVFGHNMPALGQTRGYFAAEVSEMERQSKLVEGMVAAIGIVATTSHDDVPNLPAHTHEPGQAKIGSNSGVKSSVYR